MINRIVAGKRQASVDRLAWQQNASTQAAADRSAWQNNISTQSAADRLAWQTNISTAGANYASTSDTGTLLAVKASTGTCGAGFAAQVLGSGSVTCVAIASEVSTNTITGVLPIAKGGTGQTSLNLVSVGSSTVSAYTTGNAATVTNGLYSNGSYSQPSWLTSVLGSIVSGNISGTSSGAPPTGSATGDLTGTYPAPTLAAVGTAGTYGSAAIVPTITTDSKGRVIAVSSNTIPTREVSTNTIQFIDINNARNFRVVSVTPVSF